MFVGFGRYAEIFADFSFGAPEDLSGSNPRLGKCLRVGDGQRHVDRVVADAMIPLDRLCLVAMRVAIPPIDSILREPRSVIKANRFDDEGISFPSPNGVSEPPWIHFIRIWQITAVGPNRAI